MRQGYHNTPDPEETAVAVDPAPQPPEDTAPLTTEEDRARAAYVQKVRDDLAARRRHLATQIAALQEQDAALAAQEAELG
jgi:hypothetical protein